MKKSEKIMQTEKAYEIFNSAMEEKEREREEYGTYFIYSLRHCKADVFETDNYFILRSYNTFVAAIEKSTGNMADVLRTEYGYTATSCQHIAKFFRDYPLHSIHDGRKRFTAFPLGE